MTPSAARLVQTAREAAGLTQGALATGAKTTQAEVSRIERGEIDPSVPTLRRIVESCGRRLWLEWTHGNTFSAVGVQQTVSDVDEHLDDAERILGKLENARVRLDTTTNPDEAIEVLQELAVLAKEVEAILADAKRRAEEDAGAEL